MQVPPLLEHPTMEAMIFFWKPIEVSSEFTFTVGVHGEFLLVCYDSPQGYAKIETTKTT